MPAKIPDVISHKLKIHNIINYLLTPGLGAVSSELLQGPSQLSQVLRLKLLNKYFIVLAAEVQQVHLSLCPCPKSSFQAQVMGI